MDADEQTMNAPPHIVAIPFPGQGHTSPMLNLSQAMAARGFTVSFINVTGTQPQQQPEPSSGNLRFESLPLHWNIPQGFDLYCLINVQAFFKALAALEPAFDALVQKLSQEIAPVVAIISDLFLPWTQHIAQKHDIPWVILMCASASCFNIELQAPDLASHGLLPIKESDAQTQDRIKLHGVPPIRKADIPLYLHEKSSDLRSVLERCEYIRRASWVLLNSAFRIEPEVIDALQKSLIISTKVVPVGPLFLHDLDLSARSGSQLMGLNRSEDEDCIRWLDTQRDCSVLYISFGSIALQSAEQMQQIAEALERSKQAFFWVMRSSPSSEELAWYGGFRERTIDCGYVAQWAPQLQVLRHPATAGFMTHCGWNSVMEAISSGVAMVGWPVASEQNLNCKIVVEDWKAGVCVRSDRGAGGLGFVGKCEIERVIGLLRGAEGDQLRGRAKEIGEAVKAAVSVEGDSVRNLEAFLADIKP